MVKIINDDSNKTVYYCWRNGNTRFERTKEERNSYYWLVRSLGYSSYLAQRLRDWRLIRIETYLGLKQRTDRRTTEHRQTRRTLNRTY